LWGIDETEHIAKQFKKLGSVEKKRYCEEVSRLSLSEDPTTGAEFVPTRRHLKCWVLRLTKSYRLAYRVDHANKTIQLVSVGDHKEIYGKD
jgi:mRNA-degrading endonuclease RelE of RelBE toxin-antitoxin system